MARRKPDKPIAEYITSDNAANYKPTCPECGAGIDLQATVTEFGEPKGWQFYGYQGERWLKCKGTSGGHEFTHFVTLLNGRYSHRIAWVKPIGEAVATQESFL